MNFDQSSPVHDWFSLTYASYLVLPRSILQSCSLGTQQALVEALLAVEKEARAGNIEWPKDGHTVEVKLRDGEGKYTVDDLANYHRGRRMLWDCVVVSDVVGLQQELEAENDRAPTFYDLWPG